ncbi:conserved hypothetical protein [Denitrovibrio acetiphilus DSM 12809]|uniref:Uncharacterized protein n=1 Tax=Denitrovibrio acetiphilus (strain DSM 12809 / NBRC 114555 / N2460) TaxID=522772 RepID=D4H426_DENA2|nr:hypothetical protein [Denitrovibrio acetiphilus]ADD67337.1 conserved hypothetical protein [Denitrovibrio acetiphilus DSM 12809]
MKRNELKDEHELAVINRFRIYIESKGYSFKVLERPDPPDAIIEINANKTWIEITDAFLCPEIAESITSYVADDIPHRPIPSQVKNASDDNYGEILKEIILNKYCKQTMCNTYAKYGSGILIVGIFNPYATLEEIVITERNKIMEAIQNEVKVFHRIYLYEANSPRLVEFI